MKARDTFTVLDFNRKLPQRRARAPPKWAVAHLFIWWTGSLFVYGSHENALALRSLIWCQVANDIEFIGPYKLVGFLSVSLLGNQQAAPPPQKKERERHTHTQYGLSKLTTLAKVFLGVPFPKVLVQKCQLIVRHDTQTHGCHKTCQVAIS